MRRSSAKEDEFGLPFVVNPPLIVKASPTAKMRHTTSVRERPEVAQEIYQALVISAPHLVQGRTFLVYDDVFTTGHTLNAVARRLKEAGATAVSGLALARQQWWPRR